MLTTFGYQANLKLFWDFYLLVSFQLIRGPWHDEPRWKVITKNHKSTPQINKFIPKGSQGGFCVLSSL